MDDTPDLDDAGCELIDQSRILLLYGSLHTRTFSRLLSEEVTRSRHIEPDSAYPASIVGCRWRSTQPTGVHAHDAP